jgi:hypothetical protein
LAIETDIQDYQDMIEKSHIGITELLTQKLKGSPIVTLVKREMTFKLMRMSSGITPKIAHNVDEVLSSSHVWIVIQTWSE